MLVVEDNAVNREVAQGMLQRWAAAVDAAADGLEAVEACARMPYDVVLMDCQMPETRRLRGDAAHPRAGGHRPPDVPIDRPDRAAMSGDRERCLAAGMDDYLPKPVRRRQLDQALARAVPGVDRPEAVGAARI